MKNKHFSFIYGDIPFKKIDAEKSVQKSGNVTTSTFYFKDGLKIIHTVKDYEEFDACEWVTWFENTSDKPSQIISKLWDCDAEIPLKGGRRLSYTAYLPDKNEATVINSPKGSTWDSDEFFCDSYLLSGNNYVNHIYISQTKEYRNNGGRSSDGKAPFFNIHTKDEGVIAAIGWSGQWNCQITRNETGINFKSGIENVHFRLLPHEKIRTSSVVIMKYSGKSIDGQNKWRRLVKKHFSLIGSCGRPNFLPVCAGVWGGMSDKNIFERLDAIKKNDLPFECIWMDAGWYGGEAVGETPDEFEGDWGIHTGDWRINAAHPNKLTDVSKAIHDAGMKFLLWFEPERVIKGTPTAIEHPEYFIKLNDECNDLLLDLGNEEAYEYCFNTISQKIKELEIDCYRQDFNFSPLPYWQKKDAPDRNGITQIKHIMGLYRLWDSLLAEFPHLIIDNCASGGRRIDIETLRRSVPLWRSDFTCPANYPANSNQLHNVSFGAWMPYSGTGSGRIYDTYIARSAYAGSMTTNYTFSARESFGDDPQKIAWLKTMLENYKRTREYFYADIYPLSKFNAADDVWFAVQYNRPEKGDGMIQMFKRENSCAVISRYKLCALDVSEDYVICDIDGSDERILGGKELSQKGFEVTIDKPYEAKIYFYKKNKK